MRNRICAALTFVIFALLATAIIIRLNRVFETKGREEERYSTMSGMGCFYDLEPHSLDVLFVGSSHCYYSFCPQELYDTYHITSHNLGTSGQPPLLSYYMFEDALRTQKPKVVFLETYMFKVEDSGGALDDLSRTALNAMRWTPIRAEASINQSVAAQEPVLSYFLTNMKFHDRWKELCSDDFTGTSCSPDLRGYLPSFYQSNYNSYAPFDDNPADEPAKFSQSSLAYMNAIRELCEQQDIKLVFLTVPSDWWTAAQHNMIVDYANKYGIDFFDFNCRTEYDRLGYDYDVDARDSSGHPNVVGTKKLMHRVGELLVERYGIQGSVSKAFEESASYWQQVLREAEQLKYKTLNEYLSNIDYTNHVVFIAKQKGFSYKASIDSELPFDVGLLANPDCNQLLVIKDGKLEKNVNKSGNANAKGSLNKGEVLYRAKCTEGESSVLLSDHSGADVQTVPVGDGQALTVVTYDSVHQVVTDSVRFVQLGGTYELMR